MSQIEHPALIEPLQVSEGSPHRPQMVDLAVEPSAKSAGFRRSLPEGMVTALADLVRAMNCYYSNLIEGHNTHPVDIERAMRDDYSDKPAVRDCRNHHLRRRGNLSEAALIEFSRFFLQSCIDQVNFMETLVEPTRLQTRIRIWAEEELRVGTLPAQANRVIDTLIYRGTIARGEVPARLADRWMPGLFPSA